MCCAVNAVAFPLLPPHIRQPLLSSSSHVSTLLTPLTLSCFLRQLGSMLQAIQGCDAVVYGMGSLYTSICPTLILEGVGEAIAAQQDVLKVGVGRYLQAVVCEQCGRDVLGVQQQSG